MKILSISASINQGFNSMGIGYALGCSLIQNFGDQNNMSKSVRFIFRMKILSINDSINQGFNSMGNGYAVGWSLFKKFLKTIWEPSYMYK